MTEFKYIVIPDVHGRSFWKDVVKNYMDYSDVKFIFLGDYFDPYGYETDVADDAGLQNFQDLINIKESYKYCQPDKFILLLGNHDLHYFDNGYALKGSRRNHWSAEKYNKIFKDNIDSLQMIYTAEIGEKKFVFSHAGITPKWLQYNDENEILEFGQDKGEKYSNLRSWPNFNELFKEPQENGAIGNVSYFNSLGDISIFRGGGLSNGSMVWADYHEHIDPENRIPGIVQVFGHTQQEESPINYDNEIYCLDVRRTFGIKEDGTVCELDGTPIPSLDTAKDNEATQKWVEEQEERLKKLSAFFF